MDRKSPNQLKQMDHFKLMQWIDSRRDYIEKNKKTGPDIMKEASDDLKIELTIHNIRSAAKLLGIRLRKAYPNRVSSMNGRQKIVELTARIEKLETGIHTDPDPRLVEYCNKLSDRLAEAEKAIKALRLANMNLVSRVSRMESDLGVQPMSALPADGKPV